MFFHTFFHTKKTIGQASMEDDRRHILNCIAGRALDEEPLAEDPSASSTEMWRQTADRGPIHLGTLD